jgi:hypothetical protein
MSKKTVRWKDIKDNPRIGHCSCDKCNSCGMIQSYDYITDNTY